MWRVGTLSRDLLDIFKNTQKDFLAEGVIHVFLGQQGRFQHPLTDILVVSQTQKDKYHMISLICGILKKKKRYK